VVGGVVVVISESLTTVKGVAGIPPNETPVAPVKFDPVIVTGVPPSDEPVAGETLVTTTGNTVNAVLTVCPSTMAFTVPVPEDPGWNVVLFAPEVMLPADGEKVPVTPVTENATGIPAGTNVPPLVVSVQLEALQAYVRFARIAEVWIRERDDGLGVTLSTSHGESVVVPPSSSTAPPGPLFVPHQLSITVVVPSAQNAVVLSL
jgi:hypothetical protein